MMREPMNLSSEYRRRIAMASEGSAIGAVGNNGAETQSEIIRAQIDGLFNALIRIEGVQTAAGYALALGDRVVGALREPTEFVLPKPVLIEAMPEPGEETPADTVLRPSWWIAFGLVLWGVVVGAVGVTWTLWACCRVVP